MHPLIFELGPLKVHSYGFMLAMAFLVGMYLAGRESRRLGEDPDRITDVSFWILISSVLGSRLFHVIVFWSDLEAPRLLSAIKIWEGGLVYYGGFIGAATAAIIYTRLKKMDFWQLSDIMAPSVALGLMFGRIGCTLVGCCYGKVCPSDFPLGITFPAESIGVSGIRLYPTQPAEGLGALAIFLFLWLFLRHRRQFRGQVLFVFLVLYSALRFVLEYWRDDPRGFLNVLDFSTLPGVPAVGTPGLWLSESQVVSVVLTAAVIPLWIWKAKRDKRLGIDPGPAPAPPTTTAAGSSKSPGKRKAKRK